MTADVRQKREAVVSGRYCGHCTHFCNDPAAIEAAFKGLSIMSSGHASVRAHDGLCDLHDLYLSYRDTCADFKAVAQD